MPDLKIEVSGPVSVVIRAMADGAVAAMQYAQTERETMSQAWRDEVDRIRVQSYWDARAIPERLGILPAPGQYPVSQPRTA